MKAKIADSRIVFFGTPRFAVFVLDALKSAGIVPALIVTVPDKPQGRGLVLTPPDVKVWAEKHEVPYLQPSALKVSDPDFELLMNSEWDLFIVAAYGKILPQSVLDLPARGTLNVHPSLLPKFRGASPVESQILADERTVGVSIMQLDAQMDHGPIVAQASITLESWPMRASDLEELLATEGGALLAESIPLYLKNELPLTEQDHALATFTKKIEKADGELDLSADGYQNYLKYCAYEGWPTTYFFKDGKRIKINEAVLENGQFRPLRVTPEGKKEQDWITS
jgi:methionyl-tRNA formyltransferase